jgi:hypothetical protein
MHAVGKIAFVGAGYVGAFIAAWLALGTYVASTDGPDRQLYQGMFAFGDSLYFLAIFALAAVPTTALGLYFLRQHAVVWRTLTVVAMLCTAASLVALAAYVVRIESRWLAVTPLWFMLTPVFSGAFFLAGILAPKSSARFALCAAGLVQLAVFATVVFIWTRPAP